MSDNTARKLQPEKPLIVSEPEYTLAYKVYKLGLTGTLTVPRTLKLGGAYADYYDTIEDAAEAIAIRGDAGLVIIPTVKKAWRI